jgi:hypothetical protein
LRRLPDRARRRSGRSFARCARSTTP